MSTVVRSVLCASAALALAGRFLPARATATATRDGIAPLTAGAAEALRLVVSLRDRHLWLVAGDTVRLEAPAAVGRNTERALADPERPRPEFATPAGRFAVERRDSMPEWVPPDWHYAEQARRRGRRLVRLGRGGRYAAGGGRVFRVAGGHVVAEHPDGSATRLRARDGREIVVDGATVVPPLGTPARRFRGVHGPRRLALGGELGIHVTSDPASVGKAATQGCIRLANEAITALYPLVPAGTPVYLCRDAGAGFGVRCCSRG